MTVVAWLRRMLEAESAWALVCILVFVLMGYMHSPLWIAVVGGALFGTPSLLKLVLMVRDARAPLPMSWKLLTFYAHAIVHGLAAAVAGFFMGWGIRAYWGLPA